MVDSNNSDYLVGYKKPPSHSQFRPGRSGNASGRPKKVKTVTDVFSKHARTVVNAPIKGGGSIRASMLELIARTHCSQAANGDHKSAALVLRVLEPSEKVRDNGLPELLQQFRSRNDLLQLRSRVPINHEEESSTGKDNERSSMQKAAF